MRILLYLTKSGKRDIIYAGCAMEVYDLSMEQIEDLINYSNRFIGGEGTVLHFSCNRLAKIDNEVIANKKRIYLEDDQELKERVEIFCQKQKKVKNSSLPSGILTYRNQTFASTMKKHKNCHKLESIYKYFTFLEILTIFEKIFINNQELLDNDILHEDLCSANILVGRNMNGYEIDINIIDFISRYVSIGLDSEIDMKRYIKNTYRGLLLDYFEGWLKFYYHDIESLVSYQDFKNYLNYLKGEKKLIKMQENKKKCLTKR